MIPRQVIEDHLKQYGYMQRCTLEYFLQHTLGYPLIDIIATINQGITDGWLNPTNVPYSSRILELATEPDTQRSPGLTIQGIKITCDGGYQAKPTKQDIKINLNDHTCHCGRKCNSSDLKCWWCETPIVKKGLFGQ